MKTLCLYALAVLALSCSPAALDIEIPEEKDNSIEITELRMSETSLQLEVGQTAQLDIEITPGNATDKTVTWSSAAAGVATVENGKVTAVAEGETQVRASAGNKYAICNVSVTPKGDDNNNGNMNKTYKVRISFKGKSLTATFDDNATSRALVEMMPMTLPMMDLYGDEMCYRFTGHPLPTDNVQYYLHKKGEIFYWPPGPSFVIRYIETDEYLSIQHIGQIDSGLEQMAGIGDTDVKFELITN